MVNNPTQQDVPAFYSPLTHDQHAQIGRITVLWGQVEMFVDNLLTYAVGLSAESRARLFNDRQIGSKLDTLSAFTADMPASEAKVKMLNFITLANQAKGPRNKCFHGTWGFSISKRKVVSAGAQHHRQPEQPFKASDLPKLERKLCQASHSGMLALATIGQMNVLHGAEPLFHGAAPEAEWIQEWRERHREDHQTLGRNWRAGRLPYLERPVE